MNQLLNELYGNIYKLDDKIKNIIDDIDAQVRLKNWSILLDLVKNYYGLKLDDDYKTLLLAEDNSTFIDFFIKLYELYIQLENKVNNNKNNKIESDLLNDNNKSIIDKVNERYSLNFENVKYKNPLAKRSNQNGTPNRYLEMFCTSSVDP
jgi:hypothetical protein